MYDFYYRNPRLLILTVALILVAGIASYILLPRMEDPILTARVASINTVFPGANAERVEALVTEPIEEELREIEEINQVRSQSRSGVSLITVELADEITEVDEIWSRVRDRVDDASKNFPEGPLEPVFREMDVKAYAMIVALVWEQDDQPTYSILRRHAEALKDRILAVRGSEKVRMFGDPVEEFVATLDQTRLAALGLTPQQVSAAIRNSDSKRSAGQLRGDNHDFLIEVQGELGSLDQIARTPVRIAENGDVVRLEDIATIEKSIVTPVSDLAIIDNQPAIAMGVLVRESERIDHWTERALQTIEEYSANVPAGVGVDLVFEQNSYVGTRLFSLLGNLLLGAAGVMLVIFVLMGWRSALIVGAALPLSSLMVLTFLRFLGIPIHQMSVTGLIIAIGLLIDNAIVMVDEVAAELRHGKRPGEAVRETVKHLIIPLLGSTVTTALAFAPIALMTGPAGEFVGSIAVSVILAIFSSLFVSMTIVPTFSAWGINYRSESWLNRGISIRPLAQLYDKSLRLILSIPILGILIGVVAPVAGFIVAAQLPEQFFPPADRDQFQIEMELPSQTSIAETIDTVRKIRAQILQRDNIISVDWFVGESAPAFYYNIIPRRENTPNYAQALVQLDALEGARETIRELQHELDASFPQCRILVRQLEQGPPFEAPVEIRIYGPDLERLREFGDQVRQRLAAVDDVLHTRSDLSESISKLAIEVDEEQARFVGLDHTAIAAQLQGTLEGAVGGSVLESTEELPVRVRLPAAGRGDLANIASLELTTSMRRGAEAGSNRAEHVPLSALAEVRLVPESATVPHLNNERMNEVQAYITAGVLPATVVDAFRNSLTQAPMEFPPGYRLEFGGEAEKRNDAVGNLLSNVGVLLVLMVATLVMSFGSFRMSAIIGAVAGLSMGLGLGALWLFGYPFGFMAIIGSMGLMGVAINDAIVVLAGIRANEEAREGNREAIQQVVQKTTRHIIATSLTTMAGFAPLVISGGEFWPPMAIAISGGVAGATILALYFVPSMYLILGCATCGKQQIVSSLANLNP